MAVVLVIDDDPVSRALVRRSLETDGHRVLDADNGASGLDKAFKRNPDLIIVDVSMPLIPGIEVIGFVRREEKLRSTPIIVLSAASNQEIVVKCMEAGANGYMVKPFAPDVLREKVLGML